jgi:hypothetical protein
MNPPQSPDPPRRRLKLRLEKWRQRYGVFYSKQSVFLYQMGKVGSTSIEEGLKRTGVSVSHFHFLVRDFTHQFHFRRARPGLIKRLGIWASGSVRTALLRIPNRQAKVITLVREPMARNIAAFFQMLRNVLWEDKRMDTREHADASVLLRDAFHGRFRHESAVNWMDQEIGRWLGVDVYAHPFDRAQGWTRIQQRNVDLLVLRTEDLHRCEPAIREFTGQPGFRLERSNLGAEKWYGPLYRDFCAGYTADPETLSALYNSRYMQHFYTMEETEAFRRRWLRQPSALHQASEPASAA